MVPTLPQGDHTDPSTPGLQLRVLAKRRTGGTSRTWMFRYKWRGEPVRIAIGHVPQMTLANARERAMELRHALDEGIDPRRSRPRRRSTAAPLPLSSSVAPDYRHSVEFLISEFTTRYLRPHRKDPAQAEWLLSRDVLPTWKGRDARTITPEEVIDLLDGVVDRGAPVLANRTASLLGLLFRFGVQRRIVAASPVQLLMPPGGPESSRDRVLSDTELKAYLADPMACAFEPKLAHVVTLLLLTGQRRGELAKTLWRDIDLDAREWTITKEVAKNKLRCIVPLTAWAVEEFRALRKLAGQIPWVLPRDDGKDYADPQLLTRGLSRCLNRFRLQGIEAFRLHDLRRTCRTGLSRLKVLPHIAECVLNHVQPGIIGVYDRFEYLDEKREALEKWAAYLEGLKPSQAK
jgi:integrase